jgi:hypothetical protein
VRRRYDQLTSQALCCQQIIHETAAFSPIEDTPLWRRRKSGSVPFFAYERVSSPRNAHVALLKQIHRVRTHLQCSRVRVKPDGSVDGSCPQLLLRRDEYALRSPDEYLDSRRLPTELLRQFSKQNEFGIVSHSQTECSHGRSRIECRLASQQPAHFYQRLAH